MNVNERPAFKINGFPMLLLGLVGLFGSFGLVIAGAEAEIAVLVIAGVLSMLASILVLVGLVPVQPNESRALLFLGSYVGSIRESGFWWSNPFTVKKVVSLKARNFHSDKLKVNDQLGNPIEIGAVIVWSVTDGARALFDVDNYATFVGIQAETAIRALATRYPYDEHDAHGPSLRASQDEIAAELKRELQARLEIAGVRIDDARISHLAYSPEIAQAMLRRQQAHAVISARKLIVEGAVGMVQMALAMLAEHNVVELDEERKAQMVSNLLVVLVSESETQPVLNTGSIY